MLRELSLPLVVVLMLALWLFTRLGTRPDERHGHPPGTHGGRVVSLGGDRYHAEAVIEAGGVLRLYMLGADETRVIDVEQQTLTAWVRADEEPQARPVRLEAEPQPDDAAGRTSQFAGRLPADLQGRGLDVTIPAVRIEGQRFRIAFAVRSGSHAVEMPGKVVDDEERELYLVPGGRYTKADVEANGRRTASQAFGGFRARHDFNPRPGDPLCPVTRTKAHPECTWIIDGQTYEFCCPPCVDEFVRLAKQSPDEIMPPDAYVKR